ncbi:MAG: hypothetical protein ACRCY3_04420 [Sphingorhabdus sp.]
MQLDRKFDSQTRAIVMAMGGAAVAAVVAMFIPVGIWETLTGSTGISEMIPATAAPLGDTARALIAFGFASLTFAILSLMLLRRHAPMRSVSVPPSVYETATRPVEEEDEASSSLMSRIKDRISAFAETRRGAANIEGLEDLPKLRSSDTHPDAPPRRPLLATRDLADPEPTVEGGMAEAPKPMVVAGTALASERAADRPLEPVVTKAASDGERPPKQKLSSASLAEMVERLDVALAKRADNLAQLERLVGDGPAAKTASSSEMSSVQAIETDFAEQAALKAEQAVAIMPTPEAVVPAEGSEELDAALRSALETLHRMNARTR